MDMKTPLFSVIMPCHGMGKFIRAALESVGRQSEGAWEVVAVDDAGPRDGTEEAVREFARRHPQHRVEWIRHEKNTGVSGARNTAIAAARGEYLAFLDPDDLWEPTYLETVKQAFLKNPETTVVGGPAVYFDENEKEETVGIPEWQAQAFPHSLAINNFLQPSATVVRREAVQELGGFDTDPGLQHIEDYDLWIRLAVAGKRFFFLPWPLVRYRKHASAATGNPRRMDELHEHLVRKHAGFFAKSQRELMWGLHARNQFLLDSMRNPWSYLAGKIRKLFGLEKSGRKP